MSLPYTYKSIIEVNGAENYEADVVTDIYYNELNNNELTFELSKGDLKIEFLYQSLFNIKYPVELVFEKKGKIYIVFEAKLIKLSQISIALIVFIAFFSSFGINGFLWFSAIFTLIFFSVNVLFLENGIQKLIKATNFYKTLNPGTEGQFSEDQLKWLNDTSKCPACGESLQEYDQNCPDCGLKLPRKPIAKPFDVSKYENKRLSYFYRQKK